MSELVISVFCGQLFPACSTVRLAHYAIYKLPSGSGWREDSDQGTGEWKDRAKTKACQSSKLSHQSPRCSLIFRSPPTRARYPMWAPFFGATQHVKRPLPSYSEVKHPLNRVHVISPSCSAAERCDHVFLIPVKYG